MTNTSGSKRFLSGRLKLLIVATVAVIGLLAFAVWLIARLKRIHLARRSECGECVVTFPG